MLSGFLDQIFTLLLCPPWISCWSVWIHNGSSLSVKIVLCWRGRWKKKKNSSNQILLYNALVTNVVRFTCTTKPFYCWEFLLYSPGSPLPHRNCSVLCCAGGSQTVHSTSHTMENQSQPQIIQTVTIASLVETHQGSGLVFFLPATNREGRLNELGQGEPRSRFWTIPLAKGLRVLSSFFLKFGSADALSCQNLQRQAL